SLLAGQSRAIETGSSDTAKAPAAASAPAGLSLTVESVHLGTIYGYYNPPASSRFLAIQLKVVNHGQKPVAIRSQDMLLRCDGTASKLREPSTGLRNTAFQVRGHTVMISKFQPTAELQAEPDKPIDKWIVFGGLPAGNQVPPMVLRVVAGGTSREIDIN